MFKDPFSPDHTLKPEDHWLRYYKRNPKNPRMVRKVSLARQEIQLSYATMGVTPTGSWPGELNFQPEFQHLCLQVGSKTRSSL